MKRSKLLKILKDRILSIKIDRPVLVSIDGVDAAGKTIFAKQLAIELEKSGLNVIQSSIDGFHNPREIRYRRGRENSDGYYRDSFNYEALRYNLLDPLKKGDLTYKTKYFDYSTNSKIKNNLKIADKEAILIFEGVFSNRPELRDYWDYSIYLHIDEDESIKRGLKRDGGNMEALQLYKTRYIIGQRIYQAEAEPLKYACIIIDNNDPDNPKIL
jgi:uridine kinase